MNYFIHRDLYDIHIRCLQYYDKYHCALHPIWELEPINLYEVFPSQLLSPPSVTSPGTTTLNFVFTIHFFKLRFYVFPNDTI